MIHFTYSVRVCLAVAFLLYLPFFSEAQVSISANDVIVQPEETFTVNVTAQGFQNILTSQFSVYWDSAAFEFKGAENLNPVFVDYPLDHFGFAQIGSGKLGFSWFDFSLAGVSIENDGVLFSVRLKALQEESADMAFGFSGDPTTIEIADTDENILEVEFHEGTITIDGITGTLSRNTSEMVQAYCFPNPFKERSQVSINFQRPTPARITIHDALGVTCYHESATFPGGLRILELSKDILPHSGTYILKIESKDFLITHKLIML